MSVPASLIPSWANRRCAVFGDGTDSLLPKLVLNGSRGKSRPKRLPPDKEAGKRAHLHAPHPGHVVCVDGKTIGRLLNIGRVYVQAGIDGNCRVAFAKSYQDKTADSAADFLEIW